MKVRTTALLSQPLIRLVCVFGLIVAILATALSHTLPQVQAASSALVSIQGTNFLLNGQITYSGKAVQGELLNSRMIQGLFDDENPATVGKWAYPDTHKWDPMRNTNELIAALPSYAHNGIHMITVGLQGGCPSCSGVNGKNITTAFRADGSLKAAWLTRLDLLIRAANSNGIVVDLSLFYHAQDKRVKQAAIPTAINNIVDWLVSNGYTNVLLEIANEVDQPGFWPSLQPAGEPALIAQAQQRANGHLKVSVSFVSSMPTGAVVQQEDFITIHGNGRSPAGIQAYIAAVRALPQYKAHPKPIVINEDSTRVTDMNAAVQAGASWGYYDQGLNNYNDGYQAPPVNWSINTTLKKAFFAQVAALTK
jgi:hypothetical protein